MEGVFLLCLAHKDNCPMELALVVFVFIFKSIVSYIPGWPQTC